LAHERTVVPPVRLSEGFRGGEERRELTRIFTNHGKDGTTRELPACVRATRMNTDKELICGGAEGGRRGSYAGRKYGWHPLFDVPIEGASNCWGFIGEECEGRIEGGIEVEKCFWRREDCSSDLEMSCCRADTQDVKDRECEQPEERNTAAAALRFCRFHGGICAWVCGGLAHELSLGVGEKFNRRNWSERRVALEEKQI
jgi:hypothetical protein